ncbi:hypothetical protein Ddye_013954 [Dipteronia dyeriana]|uniref:Uncharacterized protein n=1 Tax=Dipteronia dyeriana TaxID=168575 RepID=A0AAD9X7Y2_9ROSI|nr:hypothetical protein Ddye_013954 [Dipteronia dyeriana]
MHFFNLFLIILIHQNPKSQENLKMAEAAISKGAEIAVGLMFDSISTPLGYIWNYKTNFENLERQRQKLDVTRTQVQHSVHDAMRNGEEIEQKVKSWRDKDY